MPATTFPKCEKPGGQRWWLLPVVLSLVQGCAFLTIGSLRGTWDETRTALEQMDESPMDDASLYVVPEPVESAIAEPESPAFEIPAAPELAESELPSLSASPEVLAEVATPEAEAAVVTTTKPPTCGDGVPNKVFTVVIERQ